MCDQGDYRAIDTFVDRVVGTYGRIDILVNNAGGTVPAPHVEDIPELVQKIQGAPRGDDDFERTVLFHSFAIQITPCPLCNARRSSQKRLRESRGRRNRQRRAVRFRCGWGSEPAPHTGPAP